MKIYVLVFDENELESYPEVMKAFVSPDKVIENVQEYIEDKTYGYYTIEEYDSETGNYLLSYEVKEFLRKFGKND